MNYKIALGILVLIGIRIGLHYLDKKRIYQAAERKGWRDSTVEWAPFAPGSFFERNERNYLVVYVDQEGLTHEVYCKTSLMTGIYWSDENTVTHLSRDRF